MEKNVLLVLVGSRKISAVNVQKTLTGWGCLIKTRLGVHEVAGENCSDSGLLFLELTGDKAKHKELARKLQIINGVKAELVTLKVDERAEPARFTPVHPKGAKAAKPAKKKAKK